MTPWGQKAIEDVARAICRLYMERLDDFEGAARKANWQWFGASLEEAVDKEWRDSLDDARAAILAYNAALREPSAEIISAGSGVSMEISANQVSHALEAMLTRADEEIAP